MKPPLVIRKSKLINHGTPLNLVLTQNCEKVYWLWRNDKIVHNDLDYNKISDYFNSIETEFMSKEKI